MSSTTPIKPVEDGSATSNWKSNTAVAGAKEDLKQVGYLGPAALISKALNSVTAATAAFTGNNKPATTPTPTTTATTTTPVATKAVPAVSTPVAATPSIPVANVVTSPVAVARPPIKSRQIITDAGYGDRFQCWCDLQHQGIANDYVRMVGPGGGNNFIWPSAALAGAVSAYTDPDVVVLKDGKAVRGPKWSTLGLVDPVGITPAQPIIVVSEPGTKPGQVVPASSPTSTTAGAAAVTTPTKAVTPVTKTAAAASPLTPTPPPGTKPKIAIVSPKAAEVTKPGAPVASATSATNTTSTPATTVATAPVVATPVVATATPTPVPAAVAPVIEAGKPESATSSTAPATAAKVVVTTSSTPATTTATIVTTAVPVTATTVAPMAVAPVVAAVTKPEVTATVTTTPSVVPVVTEVAKAVPTPTTVVPIATTTSTPTAATPTPSQAVASQAPTPNTSTTPAVAPTATTPAIVVPVAIVTATSPATQPTAPVATAAAVATSTPAVTAAAATPAPAPKPAVVVAPAKPASQPRPTPIPGDINSLLASLLDTIRPLQRKRASLAETAVDAKDPNYATIHANSIAPKSIDVLLLANADCMPLINAYYTSLTTAQYVTEIKTEEVLSIELSKPAAEQFLFLRGVRKVIWILTTNVWTFPGCIKAASVASNREGMDVALIRQDGAMWDGMNFPSYAAIEKFETGKIFSSKAVEHLAPYYDSFVEKMADRLGQPVVVVQQYLTKENTLINNATGLLKVLDQCQNPDKELARTTVGTAALVMQRWVELYGKSDSFKTASTTSPLTAEITSQLIQAVLRHWTILEKYDVEATATSLITNQKVNIRPISDQLVDMLTYLLWTLETLLRTPTADSTFFTVTLVRRIIVCAYASRDSVETSSICFVLLLRLSTKLGKTFVTELLSLGGLNLIRSAINTHLDDQPLVLHSLLLLLAITSLDTPTGDMIQISSETVYPALVRYSDDVDIQSVGWQIWSIQPVESQLTLLRNGAISQVLLALQNHASDESIIKFGLDVAKRCVADAALLKLAVSYGLIESLIQLANTPPTNTKPAIVSDAAQLFDAVVKQLSIEIVASFAKLSSAHEAGLTNLSTHKSVQAGEVLKKIGTLGNFISPIPSNNLATTQVAHGAPSVDVDDDDPFVMKNSPPLFDHEGNPITKKYDIFLSHRQIDAQDLIKTLKIQLELDGYSCFLDRDDAGLLSHLPTIVKESHHFIFVQSNTIYASKWCAQELQTALDINSHLVLVHQDGASWNGGDQNWPNSATLIPEYQPCLKELHRRYDNNMDDIVQHSIAYFNEFYQNLIQKLGPPRILVAKLVNKEKTLVENLTVINDLLQKQHFSSLSNQVDNSDDNDTVHDGEKTRIDATIIACITSFIKLVNAGTYDTFDSDSISTSLWQSVFIRTVEQLKRSVYELRLYLVERIRHATALVELVAALLKLQTSLLPQVESTQLLMYLSWILRDYGLEAPIQFSAIRLLDQLISGSLKKVDAGVDNKRIERVKVLDKLLALVDQQPQSELNDRHPLRLLVATINHLGMSMKPQDQRVIGLLTMGLSNLQLIHSLTNDLPLSSKVTPHALSLWGYHQLTHQFFAEAKFQSTNILPIVESLKKSYDSFAKESWYAVNQPTPINQLKTRFDPVATAAKKAARHALAVERHAAKEKRKADLVELLKKEKRKATDEEDDIYHADSDDEELEDKTKEINVVTGSAYHPETADLLKRLTEEFSRESLKIVEGFPKYPSQKVIVLINSWTLQEEKVRAGIKAQDFGSCILVIVEGSRWATDAKSQIDGSIVQSRYPPADQLDVTQRPQVIIHSNAYFELFLQLLEHRISNPISHTRIDQHYDYYIPEMTRLLYEQPPTEIEGLNSDLAGYLRVMTSTDGTCRDAFNDAKDASLSMPRSVWKAFIHALMHRLCLLNSLPLETPGRQQMMSLVVHNLKMVVRLEEFTILCRQTDSLHLNALLNTIYTYRDNSDILAYGLRVIDRCMNYLIPAHPHPMQWVKSDKQDVYCWGCCFINDTVGVTGYFDCEPCKKSGKDTIQTCERCYFLQPERQMWMSRAHCCPNGGGVADLKHVNDIGDRKCSKPNCTCPISAEDKKKRDERAKEVDHSRPMKDRANQAKWKEQFKKAGYICERCPTYAECMTCYLKFSQIRLTAESSQAFRQVIAGKKLVLVVLNALRIQQRDRNDWSSDYAIVDAKCVLAACFQTRPKLVAWAVHKLGAGSLDKLNEDVSRRDYIGSREHGALVHIQQAFKRLDATKSHKTRIQSFVEFPLMFLYDRTDAAEVARSIKVSIETNLPEQLVWDESSSVGKLDRIVRECNKCIILLTQNVFSNPFVVSTLQRMLQRDDTTNYNGAPLSELKIVLIKMDGVTWNQALYPSLTQLPYDLRPYFNKAIQASLDELHGRVHKTTEPSPSIIRYSRDYFSSFLNNLLTRIEHTVPTKQRDRWSFRTYFATAEHLKENLSKLSECLLMPQRMNDLLDSFHWTSNSQLSPPSSSSTRPSTIQFQIGCLEYFARLYAVPDQFLLKAHPDSIENDEWKRIVRYLLTVMSTAAEQIKHSTDGSAPTSSPSSSNPTASHELFLIALHVLALCSRYSYVQDLLQNGVDYDPILSPDNPEPQRRVLRGSDEEKQAHLQRDADLKKEDLTTLLYEDLYTVLRLYSTNTKTYGTHVTRLLHSLNSITRKIDINHYQPPHRLRPCTPILKFIRIFDVNTLLINTLQQVTQERYEKNRAGGTVTEPHTREEDDLVYALLSFTGNLIRMDGFDLEKYFLPLMFAFKVLLALEINQHFNSFGPGQKKQFIDTRVFQELFYAIGSLIRTNGGLSVTTKYVTSADGGMVVDPKQLCSLIHLSLTSSLAYFNPLHHFPLYTAILFAISQLVFFDIPSRELLIKGELIPIASTIFKALNPDVKIIPPENKWANAKIEGPVYPPAWGLYYLFQALVDSLNKNIKLHRQAMVEDDTIRRLDAVKGQPLLEDFFKLMAHWRKTSVPDWNKSSSHWDKRIAQAAVNIDHVIAKFAGFAEPIETRYVIDKDKKKRSKTREQTKDAKKHAHTLKYVSQPKNGYGCDICGAVSGPYHGGSWNCAQCNYDECASCYVEVSASSVPHQHLLVHVFGMNWDQGLQTYTCQVCYRQSHTAEAWQCIHPTCQYGFGKGLTQLYHTYRECPDCYPFVSGQSRESLKKNAPEVLKAMLEAEHGPNVEVTKPPVGEPKVISLPVSSERIILAKPADQPTATELPPSIESAQLRLFGESLIHGVISQPFPRPILQSISPTPTANTTAVDLASFRMNEVAAKKTLALGQVGKSLQHISHEHQLTQSKWKDWLGTQQCDLCSQQSVTNKDASIFTCQACRYVECLNCFLIHSGVDQVHLHPLQPATAIPVSTTCSLCSASSAGATNWRCCTELACPWYECEKCSITRTPKQPTASPSPSPDAPKDEATEDEYPEDNVADSTDPLIPDEDDTKDDGSDATFPELVFAGTDLEKNPHGHIDGQRYLSQHHKHQLRFLASTTAAFTCTECGEPGTGACYQCPKKVGNCTYIAHPKCFLPPGFKDPKKAQKLAAKATAIGAYRIEGKAYPNSELHHHDVIYHKTVYNGAYSCNVCFNDFKGPAYHCPVEECGFDSCMKCFATKLKASVIADAAAIAREAARKQAIEEAKANHISTSNPHNHTFGENYKSIDHAHPLTFMEKAPYEQSGFVFGCDLCTINGGATVYHCGTCSFDIHPKCFKLDAPGVAASLAWKVNEGDAIQTVGHECPLVWKKGYHWSCDRCGEEGDARFHCATHRFDLHAQCTILDY